MEFLKKLSPHKDLGPNRSHPKELLVLPTVIKSQLIESIHDAEYKGEWPKGSKKNATALINKANAEHEGQQRLIGLLPYVYIVWMAIRRPSQDQWIQTLHA